MQSIARSFVTNLLLLVLLLAGRTESLNMVVQVTVAPKVSAKLPLCSLPLLGLLQPLLTLWVTQAAISAIPDFKMIGGLVLTYRNPSTGRVRMLRADMNDEDSRFLATRASTKKATKTSPGSCSSCGSAGCSQYCGNAYCNLCGSSRRLTDGLVQSDRSEDVEQWRESEARDLALIDFNALGVQVSATVQSLLQNFLLSSLLNLLGCLGDPLLVSTTVTFLVNQTIVP